MTNDRYPTWRWKGDNFFLGILLFLGLVPQLPIPTQCFTPKKGTMFQLQIRLEEKTQTYADRKFREEKNLQNFNINFCEWPDDTRFARNKLSQITQNQISPGHNFSRGLIETMIFRYQKL